AIMRMQVFVAEDYEDAISGGQILHEFRDRVAETEDVFVPLDMKPALLGGLAEAIDDGFALAPFGGVVAPGAGDKILRLAAALAAETQLRRRRLALPLVLGRNRLRARQCRPGLRGVERFGADAEAGLPHQCGETPQQFRGLAALGAEHDP